MSVLRIIKDLIGAEDINWGDSGTTFNRETHLGGTVAMRYIDAEVIPSTTLGGYIGDHLHEQNTDLGTSSATFALARTGTSVTLDASGMTALRTFTFPDTADQEFIGDVDLASTGAGLGASLVGVRDAGAYFTGTDAETVLQELGADVYTLLVEEKDLGRKNGFKLSYGAASEINISGGMWGLGGTEDIYVYMLSSLTFTLGPGGSNPLSDDPAVDHSMLHYIYVDDTAVVTTGTGLLTASEFINSTDEPAWSDVRHGWYGSGLTNTTQYDRCIGAVLINAAGEIVSFAVRSGDFYRYSAPIVEKATSGAGVAYQVLDVSSSVPTFSTACKVRLTNVTAGLTVYFDTADTAVTPEAHTFGTANRAFTFDLSLSDTQTFYYYGSADNNIDIDIVGYFIDEL